MKPSSQPNGNAGAFADTKRLSGELAALEVFFREIGSLAGSDPRAAAGRAAAGVREFATERLGALAARGANAEELRRFVGVLLTCLSNCPIREQLASESAFADYRSWLGVPFPLSPELLDGFVRTLLPRRPQPTPPRPPRPTLDAFRASFSRRERILQRMGAAVGVLSALARQAPKHPMAAFRLARDLAAAARSGLFDRTFYAWACPDVMSHRFASPLLHYCTYGWREGRSFAPSVPPISKDACPPRANPVLLHARLFPGRKPDLFTLRRLWRELRPDLREKAVSERLAAEAATKPPLAVVVPVRGQAESLTRLVASLLDWTPPDVLLVFVDDASPDAEVRSTLERLATEHPDRVRVERLETRAGYAGACNRGIQAAGRRDVILLHQDTVVGPRWSDSLRMAAYAEERMGTATAVSDHAGVASVPSEGANELTRGLTTVETARGWLQTPEYALDRPAGQGFCLYVRRDMLDDVGLLDEHAFGTGGGAETDLCLRAWERGWKHRITTRAFVRHLPQESGGAVQRAFRKEIIASELKARHPEFDETECYRKDLWNARRPMFRLVDQRLRALDEPLPLPRVLATSREGAPSGCDCFVLERGAAEWVLRDCSRSALLEAGPEGVVAERLPVGGLEDARLDDAVVGWAIEHGIERTAAQEFLAGRPALAARLAALHVSAGGASASPASSEGAAPVVSVIVPIYNVRHWLPRCLDALLGQTLRDIEIVCVDDGSTDGSDAILRRYAERDSRIVAVFSENHGVEWSRSLAMERATGKYVMFCDPDDEYVPSTCATMAGAMERFGVDLVICSAHHDGPFTVKEKRRRQRGYVENAPVEIRGRDDVLWDKIFRRDLIEGSGLRFPREASIRRGFDAVFCFCYQLVARTAATLPHRLYVYRRRKGSLADLRKRRKLRASLDVVRELSLVFEFAASNSLPPEKQAQLLPWCEQIVAEAVPLMNESERDAGLRGLTELFRPHARQIGIGMPWLRAIATGNDAALAQLFEERTAATATPPAPGLGTRVHAVAAKLARRVPVLGTHLRGVDAVMDELRKAQAARIAHSKLAGRYAARLDRAEQTVRKLLLDSRPADSAGTTGRGPGERGSVIVTLTSYPARIRLAAAAVATLLRQDTPPDAVVLWLDEEQFPGREADLPPEITGLFRRGLEVRWCRPGLRSYKKLVPSLETWPEGILVTADDDIFYPPHWLGGLLEEHAAHPGDIVAYRTRLIQFDPVGRPLPYVQWPLNEEPEPAIPPALILPTTGGGVLFPPGSLHPDATDESTFLRVAPTADDLWFWSMAVRQGTRVRAVVAAASTIQSLDTSDEFGSGTLFSVNSRGANDRQFRAILNEFPELLQNDATGTGHGP